MGVVRCSSDPPFSWLFQNCSLGPVSYTHLDVYKRQVLHSDALQFFVMNLLTILQEVFTRGVGGTARQVRVTTALGRIRGSSFVAF